MLNWKELEHSSKEFAKFYHKDINQKKYGRSMLKSVCTNKNKNITNTDLYLIRKEYHIENAFLNIEVAVGILSSIMVTNCIGEQSFPTVKRIKNDLSSIIQGRLTS